jgi:hypothetical protein
VAGRGRARRYHCAIICCLLLDYGLDPKEAVKLLTEWGEKEDNIDGRDGSYYPWDEREHADSVRRLAKRQLYSKRDPSRSSLGQCRRRVQALYTPLRDEVPTRTHTDKHHRYGYRVQEVHYLEYGDQLIFLKPGDDGQNSYARHKAYYEMRYRQGQVSTPWNCYRFKVVRDWLADLGVLKVEDENYIPPWREQPGRCCRWHADVAVIDQLVSMTPPSLLNHYSHNKGKGWRPVKQWRFEDVMNRHRAELEEIFGQNAAQAA